MRQRLLENKTLELQASYDQAYALEFAHQNASITDAISERSDNLYSQYLETVCKSSVFQEISKTTVGCCKNVTSIEGKVSIVCVNYL
jgi:hypothetical protein